LSEGVGPHNQDVTIPSCHKCLLETYDSDRNGWGGCQWKGFGLTHEMAWSPQNKDYKSEAFDS
jgi:hypothetical protein